MSLPLAVVRYLWGDAGPRLAGYVNEESARERLNVTVALVRDDLAGAILAQLADFARTER